MKSTSLCCLVVLLTTGVAHSSEAETAEGLAFFESKIRPVLIREWMSLEQAEMPVVD